MILPFKPGPRCGLRVLPPGSLEVGLRLLDRLIPSEAAIHPEVLVEKVQWKRSMRRFLAPLDSTFGKEKGNRKCGNCAWSLEVAVSRI